jgi:copper oxidase (laccase) domain-containing protein
MIFEDLTAIGLKTENIEKSAFCTKCEGKKFFSARRGENERFCAGIMLK